MQNEIEMEAKRLIHLRDNYVWKSDSLGGSDEIFIAIAKYVLAEKLRARLEQIHLCLVEMHNVEDRLKLHNLELELQTQLSMMESKQ